MSWEQEEGKDEVQYEEAVLGWCEQVWAPQVLVTNPGQFTRGQILVTNPGPGPPAYFLPGLFAAICQ